METLWITENCAVRFSKKATPVIWGVALCVFAIRK